MALLLLPQGTCGGSVQWGTARGSQDPVMSAGLGRSYRRVAVLCYRVGLVCSVSISPYHTGKLSQSIPQGPLCRRTSHTRPVCPKGGGNTSHLPQPQLPVPHHLRTACLKLPSQGIHRRESQKSTLVPRLQHCTVLAGVVMNLLLSAPSYI